MSAPRITVKASCGCDVKTTERRACYAMSKPCRKHKVVYPKIKQTYFHTHDCGHTVEYKLDYAGGCVSKCSNCLG